MCVIRFTDLVNHKNIRMVQCRGRLCLRDESLQSGCVAAEFFVENFEGDITVELFVLGKINFAHPACADLPDDFVVPETVAFFEFFTVIFECICDFGDGWLFEKTVGAVERSQKRFDLREENAAMVSSLVRVHVETIESDVSLGRLDAHELRGLGERIIDFYGFDVRNLLERKIQELAERRRLRDQ